MRGVDEFRSPAGAERAPLPPLCSTSVLKKIANQWQCVGMVSLWNSMPLIRVMNCEAHVFRGQGVGKGKPKHVTSIAEREWQLSSDDSLAVAAVQAEPVAPASHGSFRLEPEKIGLPSCPCASAH